MQVTARRLQRHDELGFTLIELLVVMTIIAVLAAIGIPGFLHTRMRAKEAASKSDAVNIAKQLATVAVDGPLWGVSLTPVAGSNSYTLAWTNVNGSDSTTVKVSLGHVPSLANSSALELAAVGPGDELGYCVTVSYPPDPTVPDWSAGANGLVPGNTCV